MCLASGWHLARPHSLNVCSEVRTLFWFRYSRYEAASSKIITSFCDAASSQSPWGGYCCQSSTAWALRSSQRDNLIKIAHILQTLLFLWVHRRCCEEDKTTVYFQSGPRAVWPIITCISMISLSFASPGGERGRANSIHFSLELLPTGQKTFACVSCGLLPKECWWKGNG